MSRALGLLLPLLLLGAGCSPGNGAVAVHTWGEAYIEEGIPSDEFVDGWSVRYDKFLLVLRDVTVADGATIGARWEAATVFDLVRPGPKPVVTFRDLEARPWPSFSFQIGPSSPDAALAPGVTEADRALLGAASLRVVGVATDGTRTKRFDWSFARPTRFADCRGDKDGRLLIGVSPIEGGVDSVQLTIHGDHLFYDDLQAGSARLRFGPIADADADADGAVTLAELDAVRLATIPKSSGAYGTGSASDVDTLGAFVAALARTVAHFRGEGECVARQPR